MSTADDLFAELLKRQPMGRGNPDFKVAQFMCEKLGELADRVEASTYHDFRAVNGSGIGAFDSVCRKCGTRINSAQTPVKTPCLAKTKCD